MQSIRNGEPVRAGYGSPGMLASRHFRCTRPVATNQSSFRHPPPWDEEGPGQPVLLAAILVGGIALVAIVGWLATWWGA